MRNLSTVTGIVAELHHRAWQERAAARAGWTKQTTNGRSGARSSRAALPNRVLSN
jgi:hypothetical protein